MTGKPVPNRAAPARGLIPSRHHPNRGQMCRNSVKLRLTLENRRGRPLIPSPARRKASLLRFHRLLRPGLRPVYLRPAPSSASAHIAQRILAQGQRRKPDSVPGRIDADPTPFFQNSLPSASQRLGRPARRNAESFDQGFSSFERGQPGFDIAKPRVIRLRIVGAERGLSVSQFRK